MLEILVIEKIGCSEILYPENNDVVSGFGSSLALGSNVAIIGASQDKESDLYERSEKFLLAILKFPDLITPQIMLRIG